MEKTILHSLGYYLANYILDNRMSCLSIYEWSNRVIKVTSVESKEFERLEDVWYSKRNEISNLSDKDAHKHSEKEWNDSMKYRYILIEKYLPHTIKFMVNFIDFSNEKLNNEIMKGFISSMWDSDHCQYSLKKEDIKFENEIDTFGSKKGNKIVNTYVTMKLDLNAPKSYTGDDWIEIKTPQKKIIL